jgi:hypothetical protein
MRKAFTPIPIIFKISRWKGSAGVRARGLERRGGRCTGPICRSISRALHYEFVPMVLAQGRRSRSTGRARGRLLDLLVSHIRARSASTTFVQAVKVP